MPRAPIWPRTFEFLRARYLAPIAVTAPVRMSVMPLASRIAFGTPVRGSNSSSIAEFGRQAEFVVVDEVADDLDAGGVDRLLDRAAQHVEMAVGDARARDACAARSPSRPRPGSARLASIAARISSSVIFEFFDVEAVQIGDVDRRHGISP